MSNIIGTDAKDVGTPTNIEDNRLNEQIKETTNDNNNNQQAPTHYGDTRPVTQNEDGYYAGTESLFDRQLILSKDLESPCDIRYKTDYFPRGGKNAGKSQPPRHVHTVDGEQDIIIKFPDGYDVPQTLGEYYLEAGLITVPRTNQHYLHVNKFQLHHKDIRVLDENPFFIRLIPEHFEKGQITLKLVIVKTHKNDLKNLRSLFVFDGQPSSGWTGDCETVDDLEHAYQLSRMKVVFSLGYIGQNGQFIRFPNTTVMSNEIVEKEKPKPLDGITCPNCSHCFSVKEQRKADRKRSASSSNTIDKKKRRSQ